MSRCSDVSVGSKPFTITLSLTEWRRWASEKISKMRSALAGLPEMMDTRLG